MTEATPRRAALPAVAVGGGLAGAAFALELARSGRRVQVLERTPRSASQRVRRVPERGYSGRARLARARAARARRHHDHPLPPGQGRAPGNHCACRSRPRGSPASRRRHRPPTRNAGDVRHQRRGGQAPAAACHRHGRGNQAQGIWRYRGFAGRSEIDGDEVGRKAGAEGGQQMRSAGAGPQRALQDEQRRRR